MILEAIFKVITFVVMSVGLFCIGLQAQSSIRCPNVKVSDRNEYFKYITLPNPDDSFEKLSIVVITLSVPGEMDYVRTIVISGDRLIQPIIEEKHLIPDHQFGFRSKHSTVEQVHRITDVIERSLEEKKICSSVFLDVSQAFDKVWHEGLKFKLRQVLPEHLYNILRDYLTNRVFPVKCGNEYSDFKEIMAGVPQGSVFGGYWQKTTNKDSFAHHKSYVPYTPGRPIEIIFNDLTLDLAQVLSIEINGTNICKAEADSRPRTEYIIFYAVELFTDKILQIETISGLKRFYGVDQSKLDEGPMDSRIMSRDVGLSMTELFRGNVLNETQPPKFEFAPQKSPFDVFQPTLDGETIGYTNQPIETNLNTTDLIRGNLLNETQPPEFEFTPQSSKFHPSSTKENVPEFVADVKNFKPVQSSSFGLDFPSTPQPSPASVDRYNMICGKENSQVTDLIVNGRTVNRLRFPWIVAIYVSSVSSLKFQCGGTLISSRTILSAAHCFMEGTRTISTNNFLFTLGRLKLSDWKNAVIANAQDIILHPDYNSNNDYLDADIAIIRLTDSVSFSHRIRPICLWQDSNNDGNMLGSIIGWGEDESYSGPIDVPNIVETIIVSDSMCVRSSPDLLHLTTMRTLCAGYRDGSGPCRGDSGSGLMIRNGDKWVLRGIVSKALINGSGQCNLNEYTIFTDVAKFTNWIMKYILE